jgi:hypothetical protein
MNGEKIRWLVLSASYDSSFDTTTSETPYQRLLWELVAIADLRELALAYTAVVTALISRAQLPEWPLPV